MQVLELQQESTWPVLQKNPCENLELLALVTTGNPWTENSQMEGLLTNRIVHKDCQLSADLCMQEAELLVFYSQDFNGAWVSGSQPALAEQGKQIYER